MKVKAIICAALIAGGIMFVSCTKGPKGDTGATGAMGTAVIENKSVTVHTSDWTMDSLHGQLYYNFACSSNPNSAVMGYLETSTGKENMPYHDNATNMRYEFATNLSLSSPNIQIQVTDLNAANVAPSSDKTFHFVIIPPAMKKPGVNYSNYADVKAAHNL